MFWTGIEKKGLNAVLTATLPQTSLLQTFMESTMGDFERFSHQITEAIITGYRTNMKLESLGIFCTSAMAQAEGIMCTTSHSRECEISGTP